MRIIQDPIVIHTKLPDADEGMEVYTNQLSYYDMKEVAKTVDLTPPGAEEAEDPTAAGQKEGAQTNSGATGISNTNNNNDPNSTTNVTADIPSSIGSMSTPPDTVQQQENSELLQTFTQGQATIHTDQGDPAQMTSLIPVIIQKQETTDDDHQAGESYVAYIHASALDEFARHTETIPSESNRRDIDLHKVAHEVYRQIKRRLETERERGRVNV